MSGQRVWLAFLATCWLILATKVVMAVVNEQHGRDFLIPVVFLTIGTAAVMDRLDRVLDEREAKR